MQFKPPKHAIRVMGLMITVLLSACTVSHHAHGPARSVAFRTIGRIPIIEARLNGKPAYFIIDTGASVSILNTSEAAFYGFEVFDQQAAETEIAGFNGLSRIQAAGRCTVELGDLRITHLRFRTRNMNDFTSVLYPAGGRRIAGILGSDLLIQYRMRIDFVDSKVFF